MKNNSKIFLLAVLGIWFCLIIGAYLYHSLAEDPFFSTSKNLINRYQVRGPILDRNEKILASGSGSSRYYPLGMAGSPIIGFAKPRFGVEGFLEQKYGDRLINNKKSKFLYLLNQIEERDALKTTLDKNLQIKAYQVMKGRKGVVVIMKMNGEVLTSISIPSYNPNKNLSYTQKPGFQELFHNKVFDGKYEPGSTAKTIIAGTLLEDHCQDKPVTCRGGLQVGHRVIGCSKVHGTVKTMADAFAKSCNTWFIKNTLCEFDQERLKKAFHPFMARKIEKDLSEEDMAMAAIGQGEILMSPMELCQLSASIGNKGQKPEPRLVKEKFSFKKVMEEETADKLKELMVLVVTQGTAKGLSVFLKKGYFVAAKTGTAERDTPKGRVHTALLIGLAGRTKEKPEISFCILVEETKESGGTMCVPIMKEILEYYFAERKK